MKNHDLMVNKFENILNIHKDKAEDHNVQYKILEGSGLLIILVLILSIINKSISLEL